MDTFLRLKNPKMDALYLIEGTFLYLLTPCNFCKSLHEDYNFIPTVIGNKTSLINQALHKS